MRNKIIPLRLITKNLADKAVESETSPAHATFPLNPLGITQTTYHGLLCRATWSNRGLRGSNSVNDGSID